MLVDCTVSVCHAVWGCRTASFAPGAVDLGVERVQCRLPDQRVDSLRALLEPEVGHELLHLPERCGFESIVTFPAGLRRFDESCVGKYPQMFADRRSRDRMPIGEDLLDVDDPVRAVDEDAQNPATDRIGDGSKDGHAINGN